jgi:hypothetical protein
MGDTLDEPKGYRTRGKCRCQQYGNERNDNIGRKIIEETDQSENNDSAAVSFE